MPTVSLESVRAALGQYIDPYLQTDLLSAKAISAIDITATQIAVQIELGFPSKRYAAELSAALTELLQRQLGASAVHISVRSTIIAQAVQKGVQALPGVKNLIAVASGKGGVGKSTVAVNLALALHAEGANVGLLDADIYGPSQPRMLGTQGRPESLDGKVVEPMVNHGIQSISIGHLIDEDTPMIWRGPMATSALEQLLRGTRWRELDYLVIDLPPGTGDIQLTLSQKMPVSGAVIVTTPQDIALLDARKALAMFNKVQVPVLGVIENMSTHICSQCGHQEHIFGAGGGASMATQYGVALLGQLPLDIRIREAVDQGQPTVAAAPDSPLTAEFLRIARQVAARLSRRATESAGSLPAIKFDDT